MINDVKKKMSKIVGIILALHGMFLITTVFCIPVAMNIIYSDEIALAVNELYKIEESFSNECKFQRKWFKYASKPELKRIYVSYEKEDSVEKICDKVYKFADDNDWHSDETHVIGSRGAVRILKAYKDSYELVVEIEAEEVFVAIKYHVNYDTLKYIK